MRKFIPKLLFVAVVMCLTFGTTAVSAAPADEQVKEAEMIVNYDSGRLIVKGIGEKTRVEVSNMLGVKIFSAVTNNQDRNEFNISLRNGIYIVRVGAEVRRIAVR